MEMVSMMKKYNCWEFMKCGKGPDSNSQNGQSSTCPVALSTSSDGLNDGINGGRICWILSGNNCNDSLRCSQSNGISSCSSCSFHARVKKEEGLRKLCYAVGEIIFSQKRNRPA